MEQTETGAEGVAVSWLCSELQRAACQSCVFRESTDLLSLPFFALLGSTRTKAGREQVRMLAAPTLPPSSFSEG